MFLREKLEKRIKRRFALFWVYLFFRTYMPCRYYSSVFPSFLAVTIFFSLFFPLSFRLHNQKRGAWEQTFSQDKNKGVYVQKKSNYPVVCLFLLDRKSVV